MLTCGQITAEKLFEIVANSAFVSYVSTVNAYHIHL